jgi:hypothetical protein
MFRLPTYASVGDVLYPWWLRTMTQRKSHRRMRIAHSSVGNIKTHRISPRLPPRHSVIEGCAVNTEASNARFVVSP